MEFKEGRLDLVNELCDLTRSYECTENSAEERVRIKSDIEDIALKLRKRKQDCPGDTVAGSTLVRPIGSGSFATVWEGRLSRYRPNVDDRVAVKIFDQNKLTAGVMLWRFQRGIRALKYLYEHGHNCPISIVRILSVSEDAMSFSMQYLPGGDLHNLAKRAVSIWQRVKWFGQICEAVSFAHSIGIIHRDIKPANVVISGDGNAVLTDFDIVDLTFAKTQSIVSGSLGTPLFAAPEQYYSVDGDAKPTSDVFSLGKLLFFLLTKEPPPIGSIDGSSMPDYLKKVDSTSFRRGIHKALQTNPSRRQQDVSELLSSLELTSKALLY